MGNSQWHYSHTTFFPSHVTMRFFQECIASQPQLRADIWDQAWVIELTLKPITYKSRNRIRDQVITHSVPGYIGLILCPILCWYLGHKPQIWLFPPHVTMKIWWFWWFKKWFWWSAHIQPLTHVTMALLY